MEEEVQGSIPSPAAMISEICYFLLQSHNMAEIPLKRHYSSKQTSRETMNKYEAQAETWYWLGIFMYMGKVEL